MQAPWRSSAAIYDAVVFRDLITVDGNVVSATQLITQSLFETSDGGLLIGGAAGNQDGLKGDFWDALLMKVSGNGALQFASIFGGAGDEGSQGFQEGGGQATTSVIQTTDGGYGLATNSYSFSVSVNGHGSGCQRPDWWLVKTDANRQIRDFTGVMTNQPLSDLQRCLHAGGDADNLRVFPADLSVHAPSPQTSRISSSTISEGSQLPDQPTLAIQAGSPRIISGRTAEAVVTSALRLSHPDSILPRGEPPDLQRDRLAERVRDRLRDRCDLRCSAGGKSDDQSDSDRALGDQWR